MAKKIMLFILAFAVATAVIFTGCTPARKPMNTNDQYNRTGQTGQAGQYGTNQGLGNSWGTYNGLGSNNGMGNGYNTNTAYDNNGLGYNNGMRANNGQGNNDALGNNVNYNTAQTTTDLERSIAQIPGVRDARVVISGNTAYVGITADANAANNNNINNTVAQQVRSSNTNISTVYVSNDENFMNRLTNVGNGIRGGRPISGFTTELRDMVRRINPVNW